MEASPHHFSWLICEEAVHIVNLTLRGNMRFKLFVLILGMVPVFAACSKSDDSSSTSSSSSSVTDSSMATAMPSNLSVSSNTESGSSVSSRTAGRSSEKINDDSDPKKHKDKVARLQAVLNTTDISQCHKAIPKIMKGSGGKYVACYGPQLDYVNHTSDNSSGQLPSGDLGIWTAYSDNTTQEACSVGQMNLLMDKVGRKVDLAMGITAMMICAAKNDSLEKPTVDGNELDVTASVGKTQMNVKRGGMIISSATLKRSTVSSTKKIKYTSKLTGSFTYTDSNGTSSAQDFGIKFQHVPDTDSTSSAATGEGLVQMWQEGIRETDGNCGGTTLDVVTSVAYKNTSDNLSFRAVKAKFADAMTTSEFFGAATGEVRGTSSTDNSSAGWCADFNVIRANIDNDGYGKVGYAWQAGKSDGYTRTFNIKTVNNSTDNQTGDAYFGFNLHPDNGSYRSTSIDRMICNWAGPGNSHTGVSKIQRQQLSYDSTGNVWKTTQDNITFAPTNDCNFDNSTYASTTFGGSGASITNNLESISNYTTNFGSQPTKPSPTLE